MNNPKQIQQHFLVYFVIQLVLILFFILHAAAFCYFSRINITINDLYPNIWTSLCMQSPLFYFHTAFSLLGFTPNTCWSNNRKPISDLWPFSTVIVHLLHSVGWVGDTVTLVPRLTAGPVLWRWFLLDEWLSPNQPELIKTSQLIKLIQIMPFIRRTITLTLWRMGEYVDSGVIAAKFGGHTLLNCCTIIR